MEKEVFDKYIKAGRVASEVREASKKWVKVGVPLLDIAERIESMIKKKGCECAFPVNLSLNDIAAHYTPVKNDETLISEGDVLKVDIGVHADGYVGDTAYTACFNEKYVEMVKSVERALEEAIKLCVPDSMLSDISSVIEETINGFGYKPVSNLTGHGLDYFEIHASPSVPNIKFESDYRLSEDQVIAIEPFATDGAGVVKDSEPIMIFSLSESGPVRNQEARKIINFSESLNGLPFAERWIPVDSMIKIKFALRELRSRGILHEYAPLKDSDNGIVAQAEHTIIIKDVPIVTTK
jgi:methionyl aminopeptidase